jgi:endonuclease YncB( thermonuclease family)
MGFSLVLWIGLAALRGGLWTPPARSREAWQSVELRAVKVLDGDTLQVGERRYRLLGIDTPERAAPWFLGDQEPWAGEASRLVRRAIADAGSVELRGFGRRDTYGRELVHAYAGGQSISLLLVRAGLAYPTVHRFGDGGFPKLAERLVAEASPAEFETPWTWRRRHRQ